MKMGRPAAVRPRVLEAIKNAKDGIGLDELCAIIGCSVRSAKQFIGRLRDVGEPIHCRRVSHRAMRYYYDPEAPPMQRKHRDDSSTARVHELVKAAGEKGTSGAELIAVIGPHSAEWGTHECVARKMIVAKRWIGSNRAGWRYFLTQEWCDAAFDAALAERDAKRGAEAEAKREANRKRMEETRRAAKEKRERLKPVPLKHQRMTVSQPPGRGMVSGFAGDADYSKAKIIVGHSAPQSRWSSIPDGEPLFGPMSQRKPLECSEWARKAYG